MIQLQKSGLIIDADDVQRLKSEFDRNSCVLLPKLLDAELLNYLQLRLEQPLWRSRTDEGIATEDVLDDSRALSLLHFVTNSPAFVTAVCDISGCADTSLFLGRIYRFIPNSVHYDSWHDDLGDEADRRLIGMSVNLGSRNYAGGYLQLRDREAGRTIFAIANTGWGDATLFRISKHLEHRVTAVTGTQPRIAFAGWFRANREDFFSTLKRPAA